MDINPIAYIHTEFSEKFGVPRQSGLAGSLRGTIVFEPEYRNADALRGLEGFSHLWLIWEFSANAGKGDWQPTVRPPRLGGNERMGVFATRSPFRPNPLGLSCVEIDCVELDTPEGPVIHVCGADLMSGTPIYDIKPYLPYTDSHPEALGGFAEDKLGYCLEVELSCDADIASESLNTIKEILANDPRPAYQEDPHRIYKMSIMDFEVEFRVEGFKAFITKIQTSDR